MNFRIIQGGKSDTPSHVVSARGPSPADVRREAQRRLDLLGINRLRNRHMAIGTPLPRDMHYLGIQIDFAAERLCKLDPVPADFQLDAYWPQLQNGTVSEEV